MNLGTWLADQIISEDNTQITTVVAIYPGRFQPMGKHHAQAYKWLKSKFKDAHVVTSDKVDLPKSPFSFNEKKKIISSHGIRNIVKVKNPYQATELLKKYDPKTTAAVFMVGQKDAGRLGGKFFRPWKGKAEVGYKEGAYTIIAPHVSLKVPGYGEMSGTAIRTALGSNGVSKNDRTQLFKHIFGHTKNYDLITKKLGVNESILNFIASSKVQQIIKENNKTNGKSVDDGPQMYYQNQAHYKSSTKDMAQKLGMEIINFLSGEEELKFGDSRYQGTVISPSSFPAGVAGKKTPMNQDDLPSHKAYVKWKAHVDSIAMQLGMELLDYLGAEKSKKEKTPTGEKVKEPNKIDKTPNTVDEAISLPVEIGDTVLMGKFKNKKVVVKTISFNEKGDLLINGKSAMRMRIVKKQDTVTEGLITEGGAYGHMAHPFDDRGLTFGDFKQIIDISLQGNLDVNKGATEKTDGQNLFITWNEKLLAARNAGDIKRGGVDSKAIAKKFAGRGNIEKAFNYAMRDLTKAIGSISDKQKKKIFDDGNNWVNMEVMYPASSNVINYDAPHLQFHNVLQYKNGKPVGSVSDGARMLAGMITQVNANVQKSFSVIGPHILKLNPHQDYAAKKPYFVGKLKKLMQEYQMKDSNTFSDYHQMWWVVYINKTFGDLPSHIEMGLVKRWAFFDKSFRLNKKTIEDETLLAKVIQFDKQKHKGQVSDTMLPFEKLFFELGAEVLKNVEGFLAANPDKAVQNIRKQIKKAISIVKKGGDIKKINRLSQQLNKLNSIGGMKAIVPSEGLVFIYKGSTYKLTGAFAPINQITGMMYF